MMTQSEEILRRLTIGDRAYCRALASSDPGAPRRGLDSRSLALLYLAASITAGASELTWQQRVSDALESGLSEDEIVAALTELAPIIGIDRVVAVAPALAMALGYDVDAALERLGP